MLSRAESCFLNTDNKNSWAFINPLNPELNPICYLLALLGAHHFLHVSRIRVNPFSDPAGGCQLQDSAGN